MIMKEVWHKTRYFLIPQLVLLCLGLIVIFSTDKHDLHIWFNSHHSTIGDVFFRYATHLAEGLFAGIVILLAFVDKVRMGVVAGLSIGLSGGLTQFLKRVLFYDHHRPSKVLAEVTDLHFVQDVILHKSFSFPSGHATAAFSIFLTLALMARHRWLQSLCLSMALLVAYSRVYLSQHFFEDIVVGSVVGSTVTFGLACLLLPRSWGNRSALHYMGTK